MAIDRHHVMQANNDFVFQLNIACDQGRYQMADDVFLLNYICSNALALTFKTIKRKQSR